MPMVELTTTKGALDDARWGKPAKEAQIGPFQLFIYDFDLARVLRSGRLSGSNG